MIARGLPHHRMDVVPSRRSTNFTFAYDWRRLVARWLATSSLPPAQPECTPAPFLRFFLLGSSSRRHVVIPFGWLHPLIKPYLVGETARCLLPLLPGCPTSTLGSKSSDLFPRSSTGVGISSDEIIRGCRLTPPKPFQFIHVISFRIVIRRAPTQSITLPPYRFSGTVACPAAPSLAPDAPIIDAPTGFKASRLPYSMAYGGTLIPSNTDGVVGV